MDGGLTFFGERVFAKGPTRVDDQARRSERPSTKHPAQQAPGSTSTRSTKHPARQVQMLDPSESQQAVSKQDSAQSSPPGSFDAQERSRPPRGAWEVDEQELPLLQAREVRRVTLLVVGAAWALVSPQDPVSGIVHRNLPQKS